MYVHYIYIYIYIYIIHITYINISYSLVHSLTHSFTLYHSLTRSLSPTHSFTHVGHWGRTSVVSTVLLQVPRSTTTDMRSSVSRPTSSFKQSVIICVAAGLPLFAVPCAGSDKNVLDAMSSLSDKFRSPSCFVGD